MLALDALAPVVVHLDAAPESVPRGQVVIGVAKGEVAATSSPLLDDCTLTLAPLGTDDRRVVAVADVDAALDELLGVIAGAPRAALVLAGLLRLGRELDTYDGLVAESLAYSVLLAGPEFARWRAGTPVAPVAPEGDPLQLGRDGGRLDIRLNRPHRRNAVNRAMRDALVDALLIARSDPTIEQVHLSGAGPAFCSGGDLHEFGTAADPATAHVVRTAMSPAVALHDCPATVSCHVHGAVVGAGVELMALADLVVASPDAWFSLPELSMGLLPGAGGTVSISRRVGRWRLAWLALTGARIDAATAWQWGLIDEVRGDA